MNKNSMLTILIYLIIALSYNVTLFSITKEHTPIFWSTYLFTMIGFIGVCISNFYALLKKDIAMKDKFLNLPLTSILTTYLVVQFFVGVILMAIPNLSITFVNVTQIIILSIFSITAILSMIGKNVITAFDDNVREKVFYIKSAAADMERLKNRCTDIETQKTLCQLYDTIRYSDPMSHNRLTDIENNITMQTYRLTESIDNGKFDEAKILCTQITGLIIDRNNQCKLLK